MSFIKQHIALIFVILVCVVCTIESHDRGGSSSGGGSGSSGRRRGDKGSGIGSGGGGSGSASLVTGLCEKDADMKIACHCTHDHYRQRINEVDCLILHKELSHTDPAWRAFNTHTNIKNLMLTVTRNGYMGYLPISLFRNQRELNSVIIHFGNIREIPAFAFGNQTKLQNISLEKNQIEVLNEYAFANLIELNVLNLDDNQIVNISQFAFANLTALTELVLSKNNLTALHNELFTDMVNLRILKLNDNQLTLLGRDIFKGLGKLQQLDLSYNALKNLGDAVFTELWSLQELYLDSNNLEVSIASSVEEEREGWQWRESQLARVKHFRFFWIELSVMILRRRLACAQQTILNFLVRTHRIAVAHYFHHSFTLFRQAKLTHHPIRPTKRSHRLFISTHYPAPAQKCAHSFGVARRSSLSYCMQRIKDSSLRHSEKSKQKQKYGNTHQPSARHRHPSASISLKIH